MATSLARQFFEKAIAEGAAFLKNLVAEQATETEWLDFKGADHLDKNQISVNWSKFICGFANNEGGVIVWGIDARKNKVTEIDCACKVAMSLDPAWLRTRLQELHLQATDPPVMGVESVAIYDYGSKGPGFVVSYIPESPVKPHRAELIENKPYYLRIGDSFHNPSPSILRNLFFPRSSTKLLVSVQPEWEEIRVPMSVVPPQDIEIRYRLSIHNAGAVSAKDIFIIIETEPSGLAIETPFKVTKSDTDFGSGLEYPRPLHPSSNGQLCVIRHTVPTGNRTSTGPTVFVPRRTEFSATLNIFAADMQPLKLRVVVSDYELDHRMKKWAKPYDNSA